MSISSLVLNDIEMDNMQNAFMVYLKWIVLFICKIYIRYEDDWGDNLNLWTLC